MIPTFFGVTLVCFMVMRAANPNPMTADLESGLSGAQISKEAIAQLRAIYDLDKPWYVQYGKLLTNIVTLDLGTRWQDGVAIRDVIARALPVTLILSVVSLLLAYLVGLPLGIYSAVRRGTLGDRVTTTVVFMLYSLPSFWVAIMLLTFLSSGKFIECVWSGPGQGCFPLQGWHSFRGFEQMSFWEKVADVAWHLVLPVVALTYNGLAATSRYMRTAMLETIRQDYIRTARAKGVSEVSVVLKHALRNSLIPIVTLLGLTLPHLIAGSAVVEYVFGIPGMGFELLNAIRLPDYPQVISIVAFMSLLTMAGVLLSDVLYAVIDPRIRLGGPEQR